MWVVREGVWGVGYSICTVHGLYRSRLSPPLPLPPSAERERVNLSWSQWWVGKSCQLRVIQSNYPPSVFTNNGFSPPSFFCPAWSLGLHGETASNKAGVGGVRLRHHYCQLVCWSWRLKAEGFGGLSVTGCSLTVFWKARTYCSST